MKSKKLKKRAFALASMTFLFWGIVVFFLLFVDPEVVRDFPIANSYLAFFFPLFISLVFTFSLLFSSARRGLFVALGIIVFLYLRLFGLGHFLNLILLLALVVVVDLAFPNRGS